MVVDEKEATEKVSCPFLFYKDAERMNHFCLSSNCMRWRWLNNDRADRRGYCGLAGRPWILERGK